MSWPFQSLGWDDTIRPVGLSHTINKLSLSPDNKRKRRHDETTHSAAAAGSSSSTQPHPPRTAAGPAAQPAAQHFTAAASGTKRARISVANTRMRGIGVQSISLRRRLDALSQRQLVELVESLVDQQPDVAQQVNELVPPITVRQAVAVLQQHHAEIKKNIPLGDEQGDYAFLRVRPQYTSFFVALADYTVSFLETECSDPGRALEFLDLATALVHEIPRWHSPGNNQLLQRAYRELEQAWLAALEKASGSSPFAMMAGAAWDARFHAHCEKSKGAMSDARSTAGDHSSSNSSSSAGGSRSSEVSCSS